MDSDIEWISDDSDYQSDDDGIATIQSESPSILWEVIKRSAERDFDGNILNA